MSQLGMVIPLTFPQTAWCSCILHAMIGSAVKWHSFFPCLLFLKMLKKNPAKELYSLCYWEANVTAPV